ncbi:MAG: proline dehydrogenase family protein [Gemmatimonadota bacterium]
MALMRTLLLKASESRWLASHLPNYPFARQAVRRFMPGEDVKDALRECAALAEKGIGTVVTRLGENIAQSEEATVVTAHYTEVLRDIRANRLPTHVSVKLTQLGLDIDASHASDSVAALMRQAAPDTLWIDMEGSRYTDATISVFREACLRGENAGLCLQAYLKRTGADLEKLLATTTAIRLVKGAYKESSDIAFAHKSDVDANYLALARVMLERAARGVIGHAPAFATHDVAIIRRIAELADQLGVHRADYEFQLLYGINTQEQMRLARENYRVRVLISYGSAWFAWYMRRLAERPANVWFVLKSMLR